MASVGRCASKGATVPLDTVVRAIEETAASIARAVAHTTARAVAGSAQAQGGPQPGLGLAMARAVVPKQPMGAMLARGAPRAAAAGARRKRGGKAKRERAAARAAGARGKRGGKAQRKRAARRALRERAQRETAGSRRPPPAGAEPARPRPPSPPPAACGLQWACAHCGTYNLLLNASCGVCGETRLLSKVVALPDGSVLAWPYGDLFGEDGPVAPRCVAEAESVGWVVLCRDPASSSGVIELSDDEAL